MGEPTPIVVPLTLEVVGAVSTLDRLAAAFRRCADDLRQGQAAPPEQYDADYQGPVDHPYAGPAHFSDPYVFVEVDRVWYRKRRGNYRGLEVRSFARPMIGSDYDLFLLQPGRRDLLILDHMLINLGDGGVRLWTAPRWHPA